MQFSEDDLRRALERKAPRPDFAQQVLASIEQADRRPVQSEPVARPGLFSFRFWPKKMTPRAPVAVLAVMLVAAVGLLQYHRYETHVKQENAKKQAVLALQIASAALHQAVYRALVRSETTIAGK